MVIIITNENLLPVRPQLLINENVTAHPSLLAVLQPLAPVYPS